MVKSKKTGKGKAQEASDQAFAKSAAQPPYLCQLMRDKKATLQDVIRYLDHGCDPNQKDEKGNTPIELAMERHWFDAAMLMKQAGGIPPRFEGNKEGDPNLPYEYKPSGTWYTNEADEIAAHTALTYFVTKMARVELIYSALLNGADVNKKNSRGESPLELAHNYHNGGEWPWLATQLVKLGAWIDPDKPDANEVVNPRTGATRLLAVILEGKDYYAVERILKDEGADPNKPDKNGLTPLAAALAIKWQGVEELLIRHGAQQDVTLPDPDVLVDSYGNKDKIPLLTYAMRVSNMHSNFFLSLLDGGANVDMPAENGMTTAYTACVHRELWHMHHLYEAGADFTIPAKGGMTPVGIACYNNSYEVVKWLDGKVPDSEFTKAMGKEQDTPLHYAVNREDAAQLVAFLLSKGADPNAANAKGETPFQIAAERKGNAEAMRLLAEASSSVKDSINKKDNNGYTALDTAISSSSLDPATVRYLLDQGADVKQMSPGTDKCNPAVFEMLHTNWRDETGQRGRDILEIMKMLVDAGYTDFNIKGTRKNWNSDYDTPLLYAASESINAKTETLDFLLSHGADVYSTSTKGESIAHHYVSRQNVKGMKILLKHGFDPLKHWKFSTNWSNGPHAHDGTILDEVRMLYLSDKHYKREKETRPILDLIEGHLRSKGVDPDKIPYPVMLAPTYYEHQEALGKKWREEEEKKNPKKKPGGLEP